MIKFRKCIKYVLMILMLVIVNFGIFELINIDFKLSNKLVVETVAEKSFVLQLFYKRDNEEWNEPSSQKYEYNSPATVESFELDIDKDIKAVRIDTGDFENKIDIKGLYLKNDGGSVSLVDRLGNINLDDPNEASCLSDFKIDSEGISYSSTGIDPYFVVNLDKADFASLDSVAEGYNNIVRVVLCIMTSAIIIALFFKSGLIIGFLREAISSKRILWSLSVNDFKTKYAGSFFGIIWAFVQPMITICLYWFVFQVGFRSTDVGECPFVLWLICGLVPWFFLSDAIINATNSMSEYSYLVKKVVFKISILPIVKIISALFVHMFFMLFTIIVFSLNGFYPSLYTLQILYYSFSLFVLVLGISYASCAIIIFFRDLGQIINILLQIGMWVTPIMWHYTMLDSKTFLLFKINPVYYIVQGYRDSLIDNIWFWERPNYTIYFWVTSIIIFGLGSIIFKRLKVHFADVL